MDKDKILLIRHLGRIVSWLKAYVDRLFGRMTEASAEAERVTSEMSVLNTEVTSAEEARQYNETQRSGKAKLREAHEKARISAEEQRAAAETQRTGAEAQRIEAETARAEAFAGYAATIAELQRRLTALESTPTIILEQQNNQQ